MLSAKACTADSGSETCACRGEGSSAKVRRSCSEDELLREELLWVIPRNPDKRFNDFDEGREPFFLGLGEDLSCHGASSGDRIAGDATNRLSLA